MNDIEKKALALFNEIARERGATHDSVLLDRAFVENEALCRAIEQHEAFRQEVSDAVEAVLQRYYVLNIEDMLSHFIIAKPDPLVEAVKDCQFASLDAIEDYVAKKLREALAKLAALDAEREIAEIAEKVVAENHGGTPMVFAVAAIRETLRRVPAWPGEEA